MDSAMGRVLEQMRERGRGQPRIEPDEPIGVVRDVNPSAAQHVFHAASGGVDDLG